MLIPQRVRPARLDLAEGQKIVAKASVFIQRQSLCSRPGFPQVSVGAEVDAAIISTETSLWDPENQTGPDLR
jgi:molybdopterin biosynthesis enzyme